MAGIFLQGIIGVLLSISVQNRSEDLRRLSLELEQLERSQAEDWSEQASRESTLFYKKPQDPSEDTVKLKQGAILRPESLIPKRYQRWRKRSR